MSCETYIGGNTLYVFDLMPDLGGSCHHFELVKNGNICVALHFNSPPTETSNVIIYTPYKNLLQIN